MQKPNADVCGIWSVIDLDIKPNGAASLDSQSVKTATPASTEVGYDGGKKGKGRKRHLMVDTLGLVLMVVVTAANISDLQGAQLLFAKLAKVPPAPVVYC